MPENESPSKTFLGVRFVLFGFDAVGRTKVLSKLINGGGVDAGQDNQNCTHVIVDKIVYDDPICVAARNDGKTLVTGLWVDHSFDTGMPVDANSIMYRPLRDLNGIPGAKSLIVCLTGYQRQDRDDIMTMVGLMGAQFSKPLVANKVTHLVCYKFEGEKYELAYKMKKIKLVNHRWLEDCLRDWDLLPEDNYKKSGYELEMMEAQAKDSEDEADDTVKQSNRENANKSPHNLRIGTPKAHEMPQSTREVPNLCELEGRSSIVNAKDILVTPGRKSRAHNTSGSDNGCVSALPHFVDAGSFMDTSSVALPDEQQRTPNSAKMANNLEFISGCAERPPCSAAKFGAMSCSRKTPRRSPSSIFSGESGNVRGSPKIQLTESTNISSAKVEAKDLFGSTCAEIPRTGSGLLCEEVSNIEKLNRDVSCSNSKSEKMSYDMQTCVTRNQSDGCKTEGLEPAFLVDGLSKIDDHILADRDNSMHDAVSLNASKVSPTVVSVGKSSKLKKKLLTQDLPFLENAALETRLNEKTNNKILQASTGELRESILVSEPDCGDFGLEKCEHVVRAVKEPHKQHLGEGFPPACNTKSEMEKYDVLANLDVLQGGNDNSVTKPVRKKMLAKKTLGSRPKLRNNAIQKGSVCLNKSADQNDSATGFTVGKEMVDHEKFSDASEHETFPARVDVLAVEVKTKDVRSGDDIENRTDLMDDETEAPAEKDECENVLNEGNADVVGLSHDDKMRMQSEGACHATSKSLVSIRAPKAEGMNAAKLKEDEPTSKGSIKGKASKGKKQPSVKSKTKTVSAADKKANYKKVSNSDEAYNGKNVEEKAVEKDGLHSAGLAKSRAVFGKESESCMEVEKENKPVVDGDQTTSQLKYHVLNIAVKSDKMPIKINKKASKSNANSTPVREVSRQVKSDPDPVCFILSGHKLQRKEFQEVIRRLKGKLCRDSHQWSYQATHFIAPDPIRRTEKFFAAAASGRWILKTDYLTACSQVGRFLPEEPHEWHKNGLSEDGAINLEAPRKWRLLRERTGHGAFYGMRIIIYGECITPPLDTLKRVVKAGDGTILATSPPYTRFLASGIDYAIVSPGMPRVDLWVQEFLKHEIPCVVADYLVEYVCKAGYSLERHVLYNTHAWAESSFAKLLGKAEEIVCELTSSNCSSNNIACQVCGSPDRGEVMLICGDESGSVGCGAGMHIDCCDPPLKDIPKEDWFCPQCSRSRNSTNPPKKRRKRTYS